MNIGSNLRLISASLLRLHVCFGAGSYFLAICYLLGTPSIAADSIVLDAMSGFATAAALLGLGAMATTPREDAGTIWLAVSVIASFLVVFLAPAIIH